MQQAGHNMRSYAMRALHVRACHEHTMQSLQQTGRSSPWDFACTWPHSLHFQTVEGPLLFLTRALAIVLYLLLC